MGKLVGGPEGLEVEHVLAAERDGEDAAREVVAEDVVEGDEAELARVAGGARDGHAPRLEQRPQILLHPNLRP